MTGEDDPHGLVLRDVDPPSDGLLVEVRAAGVGFPDLLMRRGGFQVRQPTPFVLGWEAAGVVVAAPAASRFAVGDAVMTISFGAYAEVVAATEATTFPVPPSLSFADAAAVPLNYLTALAGLRHRGRLAAGETVVVQGAGGGAGSAAVHVARWLGAGRVIGVASDDDKAALARAAGAHTVIAPEAGWEKRIREEEGGVDIVFDTVGGRRFGESLRALRTGGRLVVVGFAAGEIPTVEVNRLLHRNVDICGCTWSVLAEIPGALEAAARDLTAVFADGETRPPLGERHAFEDLPVALDALASRRATGKLILEIGRPLERGEVAAPR